MNATKLLVPLLMSILILLVDPCAAQDPDEAAKQVVEMIAAYKKSSEEHAALSARAIGAPPEERRELARKRPSAAPVIQRAEAFIKESPAHAAVPEVAGWLLEYLRSGTRSFVYEALLTYHLGADGLGSAVLSALYDVSDGSSGFLRAVMDNSTNAQARAAAGFGLGYRMRNEGEEAAEERLVYLRAAVNDLGDLELRGRRVKEIAEAHLFAAENLAIGKVAPEIEGSDARGVAFKLTDLRGKVVVLDFWGHW